MKNFKELDPLVKAGPEHNSTPDFCPAWWEPWLCSLPRGHGGRHEASGFEHVFAVWDD